MKPCAPNHVEGTGTPDNDAGEPERVTGMILNAAKRHRDAFGHHRLAGKVPYQCTCDASISDKKHR